MLKCTIRLDRLMMGVILLGSLSTIAMKEDYTQGVKMGEAGMRLGDPSSLDDGFLKRDGDTSGLSNLNDTTLSGNGGDALADKSGPGDLLYTSQKNAINAREEHQINQDDAFIKGSMAIESDPLKQTGGQIVSRSETIEKDVSYTCQEGVTFDVDLMRQLVYELPPMKTYQDEVLWTMTDKRGHLFLLDTFWTLRQGVFLENGGYPDDRVLLDHLQDHLRKRKVHDFKIAGSGLTAGTGMSLAFVYPKEMLSNKTVSAVTFHQGYYTLPANPYGWKGHTVSLQDPKQLFQELGERVDMRNIPWGSEALSHFYFLTGRVKTLAFRRRLQ